MKGVLLAAGRGTRLEPITLDRPKCLVPVGGVPIVDRMIRRLAEAGIDDLVVVTGHCGDVLAAHLAASADRCARAATVVYNEHYHDWGNFYSLLVARDAIGGDSFVKLDADVVMDGGVLPALLAAPGPAVLAIDRKPDLGDEEMKARVAGGRVVALNKRMAPQEAFGESIGIERIDAELAPTVFDQLAQLIELGETDEYYERAYERMMAAGVAFGYADITACAWTEIDTAADLARAEQLAAAGLI
ncbi:MAG: phosphocholine cytidylyltransferase family protein [Deltaproteobacteria bacterium]|nr:MAG: phosphocholine cytidylyltransferase family protein [Deltaproteobacteria bacterium]